MAIYAKRASLYADEQTVLTGTALTVNVDTSQAYNLYVRGTTPANGDSFTQSFVCAAGTYTLTTLGETNTDNGLIDWYIDNVLVISGQDWYAAALTRNVIVVSGSISIGTDGYHVLKGVINGKNASSTNYAYRLTKYWLKQAAD